MNRVMTLTLTPDQVAWLEEQVRCGAFASVQDGVREAVARMMPPDGEELEWVRPYLDEARASVARGEVVEAKDVFAALDEHLKSRGA